ncbi:hypothetical protein [Paenibacillus sp. FSL H7-0331]|uniref:hypothetical protein n=1 Tax=Paenibacillus sp. FSL H7-0331 TaxID=1920421 RepID=UPI00096D9C58|nr:hypothetical protein [Paenibacillus sp. FSL H7-0331]OME97899.1 hypothetical protein BK127_39975 [Paenibacillus sp. FSL H7-0331]
MEIEEEKNKEVIIKLRVITIKAVGAHQEGELHVVKDCGNWFEVIEGEKAGSLIIKHHCQVLK